MVSQGPVAQPDHESQVEITKRHQRNADALMKPPLATAGLAGEGFRVVHLESRNLDEARMLVAGVYNEHRLTLTAGGRGLDYRHEYTHVGALCFGRITYKAEVRIDPDPLEFRGTTPMHHLKNVRLQRVRDELLAASPNSTTVTSLALRWGFSHLGHFTADHRRCFGESRSTTLNR
ncbi:MAG: AraC family transcriptional regulator [Rubrivivax sp.]|nr:AraC family transcriptional regulator [Rubrivivax sp.]